MKITLLRTSDGKFKECFPKCQANCEKILQIPLIYSLFQPSEAIFNVLPCELQLGTQPAMPFSVLILSSLKCHDLLKTCRTSCGPAQDRPLLEADFTRR